MSATRTHRPEAPTSDESQVSGPKKSGRRALVVAMAAVAVGVAVTGPTVQYAETQGFHDAAATATVDTSHDVAELQRMQALDDTSWEQAELRRLTSLEPTN